MRKSLFRNSARRFTFTKMFHQCKTLLTGRYRTLHCAERGLKVALMGAMGKIGQPLSLLLKQSPWFDEIAVHDNVNPKGLALELNHVDTKSTVTAHEGEKGHASALKGADMVLIVSGHPAEAIREQMVDDIFTANCQVVMEISKSVALHCPQAVCVIATSPVNSTFPIACEVFKKVNRYVDPGRMFGLMTLNSIRASTHLSDVLQISPETVEVPIIGGNSPTTAVPVLSQARPCSQLTTEEVIKITRAIQGAGDEVIRAENGKSSAILSIAYATMRFAISLAKALNGVEGIRESALVMSNVISEVSYFASPLQLGLSGIEKNLGIPELTSYECCLLETAMPFLKTDIEQGEKFISEAIKVRAV